MTVLSLGTEIATYLQGQGLGLNFSGSGTINCFVSVLPDQPDHAVAIFEHGGYPPVVWLTGEGRAESVIDNPVFQVRVRDSMTNYVRGEATIQSVFKALQGKVNTHLNGTTNAEFILILAQQSPVYIGRDSNERHEWTLNFRVTWTNLAR